MSYPFDFLVFIGRFQPFHNGHLAVVEAALRQSGRVIVLCGSSHQPRSVRNPWQWQEREQMLRASLPAAVQSRVLVAPVMDAPYSDERWVHNVQAVVKALVAAHHALSHESPRIGLIGHCTDRSSYYLNLFPQWGSVPVDHRAGINATDVRSRFFAEDAGRDAAFAQTPLPPAVSEWLQVFSATTDCRELREEQAFVAAYRKAWSAAPYEPNFVTVDAVVVQSGHVLLVERKARPGKGLLALPGGFVDPHERIREACLRELKEETLIEVPVPVLRGAIKRTEVFDAPYRSARARTITHAFYIELEPSSELPKVKGGDDARTAQWVPLGELDPEQMFEDHYFIIQAMVGL